jgi:hypothetical protein
VRNPVRRRTARPGPRKSGRTGSDLSRSVSADVRSHPGRRRLRRDDPASAFDGQQLDI